MILIEDIYGIKPSIGNSFFDLTLAQASNLFQDFLSVDFQLRDSFFIGEYSLAEFGDSWSVKIQPNVDVLENYEPLYDEYKEYLYIASIVSEDEKFLEDLRKKIASIPETTFLHRHVTGDEN